MELGYFVASKDIIFNKEKNCGESQMHFRRATPSENSNNRLIHSRGSIEKITRYKLTIEWLLV